METRTPERGSALVALSNDLAEAVERAGRSLVAINARPGVASSGIYWRPGVVVTADHTVKRAQDITVTLPDGRTVPARLAGRDPSTDLAALQLETDGTPVAERGDASLLKVGHVVLAVGRGGNSGLSASLGVISALGGSWRTWRGGQIDRFVRLDLSIFLGFSGGSLVDAQARVVGLNTTGLWRNMGLAVPASTVDRVTAELLEKGRVARGYIGLGMQPVRLPDALRRRMNLPGKAGMMAFTVEPGGPAERAGVLIGDVILALEGNPVSDVGDLQALLGGEHVGKPLRALLLRGGATLELAITVAERSKEE